MNKRKICRSGAESRRGPDMGFWSSSQARILACRRRFGCKLVWPIEQAWLVISAMKTSYPWPDFFYDITIPYHQTIVVEISAINQRGQTFRRGFSFFTILQEIGCMYCKLKWLSNQSW
jgi:hypothetical protein